MDYVSIVRQPSEVQALNRHDRATDRRVTLALMLYSLGVVAALLLTGVSTVSGQSAVGQTMRLNSLSLMYDDGFYYFRIAQQIAHGAGSTFDGLHPTNGYHPLWLLCLVPIFWLTSASGTALILGVVLQAILMAAGVGLIYHTARLCCGRAAASLAALLWVHALLTYRMALSGMEYSLQALGILATAYAYLRWFAADPPQPARPYLLLGLLAGLTFLARLDTLALAGLIGLFLAWHALRGGAVRDGVKRLVAYGAPVAIVCLAYLAINAWLFGHPLPVSGVIKRGWSERLLAQDPYYQSQGWLIAKAHYLLWPLSHLKRAYLFYLVLGTLGVSACWLAHIGLPGRYASHPPDAHATLLARWQRWFCRMPRHWSPFLLFGLLQLFGYVLLYHGGFSFQPWYYVIQLWLTVMLVAALVDAAWRWARRPCYTPILANDGGNRRLVLPDEGRKAEDERPFVVRRGGVRKGVQLNALTARTFVEQPVRNLRQAVPVRRLAAPILVLCLCGMLFVTARTVRQWQTKERLRFPQEPIYAAAQWVSGNVPADAIVGSWNAGMISYLSGRQVVNLDGLVNSWNFYQSRQYDLCRYWQETKITYLVDVFEAGREIGFIKDYYAPYADLAPCADRLELVWRGPGYPNTSRHAEAYRIR